MRVRMYVCVRVESSSTEVLTIAQSSTHVPSFPSLHSLAKLHSKLLCSSTFLPSFIPSQ